MISEIARLTGTLFFKSGEGKINRHLEKIFSLKEKLQGLVMDEGSFP
jgi:hypothetical protein